MEIMILKTLKAPVHFLDYACNMNVKKYLLANFRFIITITSIYHVSMKSFQNLNCILLIEYDVDYIQENAFLKCYFAMHESFFFKKRIYIIFSMFFFFLFGLHAFYVLLIFYIFIQEYTEEFRDIAGKSTKKLGGPVTDQGITLINQRHVGDDLPVILFYFFLYFNSSFCFLLLQKSREKEHVYDTVYESKSHSSVSFLREIEQYVHTKIDCYVFLLRKYFVNCM